MLEPTDVGGDNSFNSQSVNMLSMRAKHWQRDLVDVNSHGKHFIWVPDCPLISAEQIKTTTS